MSDRVEQVSTTGLVDTKQEPGAGKRRQHSEASKRQMVSETQLPGASCRAWRGGTLGRPASPHGNPKPAQHRAFAAKDHTGIPISNATGPAISCVRGHRPLAPPESEASL